MKQERMKDAMKDTFSKLELSENAKEEVWKIRYRFCSCVLPV